MRQLEIIGEAARNLDDHLLSQEASIPWSKVVGMRHILAHGYYQVDSGVVSHNGLKQMLEEMWGPA